MARIETDPNYSSPTFSRATAATDPFKKEDVQLLASAVSTHTHGTGKGLPLVAGSIPAGLITAGMIADGSITSAKILDGTITNTDLAANAALNNLVPATITRSVLTAFTAAGSSTSSSLVPSPDIINFLPQVGITSVLVTWTGSLAHTVKGAAVSMALMWAGGGTFQQTSFNAPDVGYGVPLTLWAYLFQPSNLTNSFQVYWATNTGTVSFFGNRSMIVYEFAR